MKCPPARYSKLNLSFGLILLIINQTNFQINCEQQFSCSQAQHDEAVEIDTSCMRRLMHDGNLLYTSSNNNNCSIQADEKSTTDEGSHKIDFSEDDYYWRFKYIEEQTDEFDVQIIEDSLDARVSNLIDMISSVRLINMNVHIYDLGEEKENRHYEQLAAGSQVDELKCGQELTLMLELFNELKEIVDSKRNNRNSKPIDESHIRLAKVLDSFGHYEAGLLEGRTHFLGSYSQCSGSQLILSPDKPTKARYCSALLSAKEHLDESLKKRPRLEHQADAFLTVGVCLPSSCHATNYRQHKELLQRLINTQFKLPKSLFLEEHLPIESLFCEPDSDSPLGQMSLMGKLFCVLVISWLALMFYSTMIGRESENQNGGILNHVHRSFNLKHSWNDFVGLTDKKIATKIQLDALNPIKAISSAFVILAHSFMLNTSLNMNLPKAYHSSEDNPYMATLLGGTLIIDSFYVISGLLIAFVAMRKLRHSNLNGRFNFLKQSFKLIAGRYFRLVPMYVFVFWFHKAIFLNFGYGPFWDFGYNRHTELGSCRQESWITPFTFLAAYQPLARQCMPHSWTVGGDIFFIIIMAPIIVLLMKKPKLAAVIAITISLGSNYLMFNSATSLATTLKNELADLRYHAFILCFENNSWLYTAPHYRIFSALVGVLAGYLLYTYNEAKEIPKWPESLKGGATKFSIGFMIVMLLIPSAVVLTKSNLLKIVPLQYYLVLYAMTTARLLWAIANAIIFIRMTTDWQDSFFIRNCAGTFWRCLAKLSYMILLIHVDILIYDIQITQTAPVFSKYRIFNVATYTYMACCSFGLILHVVFENPCDKIIRGFMNGLTDKSSAGQTNVIKKDKKDNADVNNFTTRC